MRKDAILLDQFVGSFSKLNEMCDNVNIYPMTAEFAVGGIDESGDANWQPIKISTERQVLEQVYARLPGRFPPLFEDLLLSYRWPDVDLELYTLLANPPGHDLSRFLRQISQDPTLWDTLIPAGFIQFAKGPDMDYDPVCFDIKRRRHNNDCPVVKIDHEEILCNSRIKVVSELAPGFAALVQQTIEKAKS